MEIVPKVISVNDLDNRNDNNYMHLAPFKFEYIDTESEKRITKLIIDKTFYDTKIVNSELEKSLHTVFPIEIQNDIKFGNDNYPEFVIDAYYNVYNKVFKWYSAENWYHLLGYPIERIIIDRKYIDILIEITTLQYTGRQSYKEVLSNPVLLPLKNEISKAIEKLCGNSNIGVFVKLDHHSTKHDYPIIECFDATGVLEHIFGGKTAIKALKYQEVVSLYMKKWNNTIGGHNEFRGFVEDGQISGISQQFLYEVYPTMPYNLLNCQEIYNNIQAEWNRIYDGLDDMHKYKDAVIDFYIETTDDDNIKTTIIEINGIGRWGPAGSSLFKWIDDPPNKDAPEFRITSN
jgi:hypothetical protein